MTRRRRDIARLRAASAPVLLARLDHGGEIVALVRAGRACHADIRTEIRAALRRGDTAYALEIAVTTNRIDDFINGRLAGMENGYWQPRNQD